MLTDYPPQPSLSYVYRDKYTEDMLCKADSVSTNRVYEVQHTFTKLKQIDEAFILLGRIRERRNVRRKPESI